MSIIQFDEPMTHEEAEIMAEHFKAELPQGWEVYCVRRLWFHDEWHIDLMSDTSGWIVRGAADYQAFREKYDLVPCSGCGHAFFRDTWACPECGETRF